MHVTYMRKRASASETYLGLKIHLHYAYVNAVTVPFDYFWFGAINDSLPKKNDIEKYLRIYERA